MWEKAPVPIITDQDPTMKNAIEPVFPITHLRYCEKKFALAFATTNSL